jgi:RND superfamily putative drug exporter
MLDHAAMGSGMLRRWGRAVHRYRWLVVALAMLPLTPWLWVSPATHLDESVVPPGMESVRAMRLVDEELAPRAPFFGLVFTHPSLGARDPAFRDAVERALTPLRGDSRVKRVRGPWDEGADGRGVSADGRRALALVELHGRAPAFASMVVPSAPPEIYDALRSLVRSDTLEILPFGPVALNRDFTQMVKEDLRRAELVVLPAVLVLLILVFGSVVAAALPLVVGLLGVAAGFAATAILAHVMPVSAYANNVVSMIGLGVAIDYSLFVVSRFRDEMRTLSPAAALARAMETSGRTVLFSGLTVAIGLLGMILLQMGSISTIGIASTIVVGFSVAYSLTLLPAILAILGPRVNALPVRVLVRPDGHGIWPRLATAVMARPWTVLVPVVVVLVLLGTPFRHIRLGTPDISTLPPDAESRRGQELVRAHFPHVDGNTIVVVLRYADAAGLTPARMKELYTLSGWLATQPGIVRVESAASLDPRMQLEDYLQLAAAPRELLPPAFRDALAQLVAPRVAIVAAHTSLPEDGDEARALVRRIRDAHPTVNAELLVTGRTAYDLDFIHLVAEVAPGAVAFVVIATAVVLFLLLGSVLLPLKAVVMNLLSITASYGALVWIFQDGHLSGLLNFTPAPIEPVIPLIMFCVLFGLSMDYEVLLLSRTQEEWERTGDNQHAVAAALGSTGRLITGAAAIMAAVFFGFGAAHAVMIKEMGVGMGIAVAMDATVVRGLLVPATMRLLGRWNWWAPAPLKRLYRRAGLAHSA